MLKTTDWLIVFGCGLLVLAGLYTAEFGLPFYDPEIRVYIDNPATAEINFFNETCKGVTVTSDEEAADFIVTTNHISGRNRFRASTELFVTTASGDFIFSKSSDDWYDLAYPACAAIRNH